VLMTVGSRVDDVGKALAAAGKDAEQPHRRVNRVVKPVIAVGEEDVAAHLAGERRAGLGELRLDRRMPGRQHQRPSAELGDLVEENLARLDVGEDLRARDARQDIAREHDHQLVAPENAAARVDDADAIAVAVKGDAEFAAVVAHRLLELNEIFRNGRVGVMGREISVDFRIDEDVPARQQRGDPAGDSPAAPLPGSQATVSGRSPS
jgi:hypothetical protein